MDPRSVALRCWRARLLSLAFGSALLLLPASAAAWNATGHVLIALLAYDALQPAQRAALVQLLQANSRLIQDVSAALPAGLEATARDRWLFALAATWPDLVRGQPALDHGTWHYVNLPLSLARGRLGDCAEARRNYPASQRQRAELDAARRAQGLPTTPSGESIREALPSNVHTLRDASAPRAERGLALSWVLHLVADAHQPLHAIALYTPERFVNGDRGGNDILVRDRGPLHRVWDELLGLELAPEAVEASLPQLRRSALKHSPGDVDRWLDRWLDEDCELGRAAVYVPAVLRAVERFEADPPALPPSPTTPPSAAAPTPQPAPGVGPAPSPPKPELALSPEYLKRARREARERARLAGVRLAELLASVRL